MPGLINVGGSGDNVMRNFAASGVLGGIAGGMLLIFFSLLYFLFVFAFGDLLNLLISLEENTRRTAND